MTTEIEITLPAHEHVPTQEQINRLQQEMVKMPQAEVRTEHYFSGGMYCRKLWRPAGTTIVGKVHKQDHFFMCAQGQIIAWSEKGMRVLNPGDIIESKAGTKRVTFATVDSVGITFHRTDKTDLDEIEAELIEEDTTALFDAANKVKFDVPAFRELTVRVIAAEKPGFWSDWTPEQQELYSANKWREFSQSRGYSEEEIADYELFRNKILEAQELGLNPYAFINDLAAQAAVKNIALDKNFEIFKSSHVPFEPRGATP